MRLFKLILLIAFVALQYRLWFGENSYNEYHALTENINSLESSNQELRLRNQVMLAEIDDLKSGIGAIEERARNELGLIKPNETFYRIVPNTENYKKE